MTTSDRYRSWGGYPKANPARVVRVAWRSDPLPADPGDGPMLAFGNGRSYGDVCLNDGGTLLDTRGLDRFIAFDPERGLLRCESGVLLDEILAFSLPRGWFLPVTPATAQVTLGGAIANDVHGKNHHRAGSFGHHVRSLELLRSDGRRLTCGPTEDPQLFRATIGGLGLTGLITQAEIQLRAVAGPYIDQERIPFANLDACFRVLAEADQRFEYASAWLDCAASGPDLGRGVLIGGDHAAAPETKRRRRPLALTLPFTPPASLVTPWTLRAFNATYAGLQIGRPARRRMPSERFFYPMDRIDGWNRIYGPNGLLRYQCVVPLGPGQAAVREILEQIARSAAGSPLALIKRLGNHPPAGVLSFPREGYTLAVDLPNRGQETRALLDALDQITRAAGGAVYPATDARMSAESFQAYYPRWQELARHADPAFSSSFWRRVSA